MKNLKLLSFSIFCLFIAFVMVGCGTGDNDNSQNNSPKACSHNYVSSTVEPTCTAQGYTLHTCSLCGNKYEDNYISATGHNYVEGEKNFACSKCGKSECDGFTFKTATYNDGEYCYVITNAKVSVLQDGVLEVPRKYESLPVRGIMNWAFSDTALKVKKIVIHSNIKNIFSDIWHGTSIWTPDWETMCSLEEIVFDSDCSDMRIEAGAFNNCPNLKKANISKGMIKYAPADAVMSSNGGNAEWIFGETHFIKTTRQLKMDYIILLIC